MILNQTTKKHDSICKCYFIYKKINEILELTLPINLKVSETAGYILFQPTVNYFHKDFLMIITY